MQVLQNTSWITLIQRINIYLCRTCGPALKGIGEACLSFNWTQSTTMATTTTDFTPLRFRHNDTIIIRNLRFDDPVEAPEAWDPLHKPGRLQPAVVSLVVYLRHGFPSAAAADALDGNTLHYGELSKKIREEAHYQAQIAETRGDLESNNPTVADLMTSVRRIVQQRPAAAEAVEGVDVELSLPKGSMFGSTVRIIDEDIWLAGGSIGRRNRRFQVEGIHTACLIGVNTIERTGRQPLVLDFEIHEQGVPTVEAAPDVYSRLRRAFNVEKLLVNVSAPSRRMNLFFPVKAGIDTMSYNRSSNRPPSRRSSGSSSIPTRSCVPQCWMNTFLAPCSDSASLSRARSSLPMRRSSRYGGQYHHEHSRNNIG